MKWKQAITASLLLLLLCATSLASACELSCSLSSSHPAFAPVSARLSDSTTNSSASPAAEATASEMTMSPSHCGHAGRERRSRAATHHFEDASTCTNAPCTQAQILSSPLNGKDGTQLASSHPIVIIAISSPVSTVGIPSDITKLEHAPPKLVLLDPLSIALRI